LEFNLDIVAVILSLINTNLVAKILLKEIKLTDYFKREAPRSFSRQVNNVSRGPRSDDGRSSSTNPLGKGVPVKNSFTGVSGILSGFFGKASPNQSIASASDKQKGIKDIIYGNNQERVASR
jgi:hypothetical protein